MGCVLEVPDCFVEYSHEVCKLLRGQVFVVIAFDDSFGSDLHRARHVLAGVGVAEGEKGDIGCFACSRVSSSVWWQMPGRRSARLQHSRG